MPKRYSGHKYERISIQSNAVQIGRKKIGKSPFHKTVNALTLGVYGEARGFYTPEHKAFASSYGYKRTKIGYKKMAGKKRKKRSIKP